MDVVQAVIDYEQPNRWSYQPSSAYTNSYLLYEVDRYQREYDDIISPYCQLSDSIVYLKRVQNPFQLGLFKIQEAKRLSEGESTTKEVGYHVINPQDLTIALKYPLDYRRYKWKSCTHQSNGKHPKFYGTMDNAYESGRNYLSYNDEIILIVCDRFLSVKNQGDYLPNYVICVSC